MFSLEPFIATPGKMEARRSFRMHREDAERIRVAAAAVGLSEADFIRQAALLRAQEVEQRMSMSTLPQEAYVAFSAAIAAPGKVVPGFARALKETRDLLKDRG